MIDVGKRIKELRARKGLSTNALADRTGISQSYLREMEMGKYNNPSIGVINEICTELDVTIAEFFDEENKKAKELNDEFEKVIYRLNTEQKKALIEFLKTMIDWGF